MRKSLHKLQDWEEEEEEEEEEVVEDMVVVVEQPCQDRGHTVSTHKEVVP